MLRRFALLGLALGMVVVTPASAIDTEPCGAGLICASNPQTVVNALQEAGYKAKLSKSESTGNPRIESAASGYNFHVYFYECEKGAKCASLQFFISFADDGTNTPDLANKWNAKKRFLQMSVDDDKSLSVSMDITTLGGLNRRNFSDVVDWWSVMLSELNKFFKEQPPAKGSAKPS